MTASMENKSHFWTWSRRSVARETLPLAAASNSSRTRHTDGAPSRPKVRNNRRHRSLPGTVSPRAIRRKLGHVYSSPGSSPKTSPLVKRRPRSEKYCEEVESEPMLSASPKAQGKMFPRRNSPSLPVVKTKLHHYSPQELAEELCLMDSELLRKIRPQELEHGAWMKEEKAELSPNVLAMVKASNRIAMLVPSEILDETTIQARGRVITIFIKVASRCYYLHNYNSLKAILAGLQCTPVFRLRKSWKEVSTKKRKKFSALSKLMSEDHNWSEYRSALQSNLDDNVPCIPFLGVLLTSIVQRGSVHSVKMGGRRFSGVEDYTIMEAITVRNRLEKMRKITGSNRYSVFQPGALSSARPAVLRNFSLSSERRLTVLDKPTAMSILGDEDAESNADSEEAAEESGSPEVVENARFRKRSQDVLLIRQLRTDSRPVAVENSKLAAENSKLAAENSKLTENSTLTGDTAGNSKQAEDAAENSKLVADNSILTVETSILTVDTAGNSKLAEDAAENSILTTQNSILTTQNSILTTESSKLTVQNSKLAGNRRHTGEKLTLSEIELGFTDEEEDDGVFDNRCSGNRFPGSCDPDNNDSRGCSQEFASLPTLDEVFEPGVRKSALTPLTSDPEALVAEGGVACSPRAMKYRLADLAGDPLPLMEDPLTRDGGDPHTRDPLTGDPVANRRERRLVGGGGLQPNFRQFDGQFDPHQERRSFEVGTESPFAKAKNAEVKEVTGDGKKSPGTCTSLPVVGIEERRSGPARRSPDPIARLPGGSVTGSCTSSPTVAKTERRINCPDSTSRGSVPSVTVELPDIRERSRNSSEFSVFWNTSQPPSPTLKVEGAESPVMYTRSVSEQGVGLLPPLGSFLTSVSMECLAELMKNPHSGLSMKDLARANSAQGLADIASTPVSFSIDEGLGMSDTSTSPDSMSPLSASPTLSVGHRTTTTSTGFVTLTAAPATTVGEMSLSSSGNTTYDRKLSSPESPSSPNVGDSSQRFSPVFSHELTVEGAAIATSARKVSVESIAAEEPLRRRSRRRASIVLLSALARPDLSMHVPSLLERYQMCSLACCNSVVSCAELRELVVSSPGNTEGQNYKLSYEREPQ